MSQIPWDQIPSQPTEEMRRFMDDILLVIKNIQLFGDQVLILSGAGSPEGVVAAPVGSIFLRNDGGTSTTFYVKETGGITSSGWVAK